ncbi:hypothetical protein GCM10008018_53140 [Paenibacillus marchantiophytorum]|uniref:Uncharacterized protein n=1 Tax=Paenibacillus marchantiophytorum TaxID=1619310 RepID=A0ABQ1F627_9BACL|nr:hypothetical protein [Paenibacillus marchantiophytorum]GGA00181.1 hypothetical protein GCM10008018_53140 [Paenibacillus marchantiophytorum]
MLLFLAALILLIIGLPSKKVREQDSRIVIAYVSLFLLGLILSVLHLTGTLYILSTLFQNVMHSIVVKAGA